MRKWANASLRAASIALCSIGIVLGAAAIGLAFSIQGPSRTLRPILTYADSAYMPLYISMTAGGLLALASLVGLLGVLYGNRAVDLGACLALLVAAGLAIGALALAGSLKGSAQTSLESMLSEALKRYGRDDPAAFDAWNDLQADMACCAVRTNMAQMAYEQTPWYKEMRLGNPNTAPKIPQSCCRKSAQGTPSQMADCTNNKPALPAQNPYMNPVGCFESMRDRLDAFTSRFIIVGILAFVGAAAALAVLAYGLVLSARQGGAGSSSAASGKAQSMKFGNSKAGSIAGSISVAGGAGGGGRQPLMSQPLRTGSSVYSSRHSLFSEPAPLPRPPSEGSLTGRSLFSEPPPVTAIQAQPMRPSRQQHQQQQQQQQQQFQKHQGQQNQQPDHPVPKPRSSVAGSVAGGKSQSQASLGTGTLSGTAMSQHSQAQPPPQAQPLQAQPMKKQQQQQQQKPIVLSAQPLRSQPPRKRQSNF